MLGGRKTVVGRDEGTAALGSKRRRYAHNASRVPTVRTLTVPPPPPPSPSIQVRTALRAASLALPSGSLLIYDWSTPRISMDEFQEDEIESVLYIGREVSGASH